MSSNSELVRLVREQKALAYRNRSVRNYVLVGGILLGIALAASWHLLANADASHLRATLFIGLVGGLLAGFFIENTHEATLFPKRAACPTCGYNWEIKEGRHVPPMERMPNWDKCPGCGQLMNEVLLASKL